MDAMRGSFVLVEPVFLFVLWAVEERVLVLGKHTEIVDRLLA